MWLSSVARKTKCGNHSVSKLFSLKYTSRQREEENDVLRQFVKTEADKEGPRQQSAAEIIENARHAKTDCMAVDVVINLSP
ncbi:hypothetical protein OUZ56_006953 [Daphnia magna]|uniref:Uncharacterized protein n=1 Tax=Daphnia magna TaxID=35525 RepID=A0ABQ9YX71_9CRUS|nr:hypothetical protein OUZ56_006953 [Daphnia magna]